MPWWKSPFAVRMSQQPLANESQRERMGMGLGFGDLVAILRVGFCVRPVISQVRKETAETRKSDSDKAESQTTFFRVRTADSQPSCIEIKPPSGISLPVLSMQFVQRETHDLPQLNQMQGPEVNLRKALRQRDLRSLPWPRSSLSETKCLE